MHVLFNKADELSREVIGAAIEVHRLKGPGLIESIYERCLMLELELRKLVAVTRNGSRRRLWDTTARPCIAPTQNVP